MIKNILIYLAVLLSAFVFNIFFYAWFSWFLLVLTLCIPAFSLLCSLPFMIISAVKGFSVFTRKKITTVQPLCLGVTSRDGKGLICPLMKINFKVTNIFTGQKKRLKFLYSGYLKNPHYLKNNAVTKNCGYLEIKAKYCKVYDLLGIFFIPVKLNCTADVIVNPKAEVPSVLPDSEHMKIIGYKPKTSGFAEEYELRNYHNGDSLKNIHWKISARHNELIVKEPSSPVYKELILNTVITQKPQENNKTLAKFIYTADYLLKNKLVFYCTSSDKNSACEIRSKEDVDKFIICIYKKQSPYNATLSTENTITYTITHNGEAVSA